MSEDLEQFLVPAEGIQCGAYTVRELARALVRGSKNEVEAAARLFAFVRDGVRYSVRVPFWEIGDYLALNTIARGKGFCIQKASLLCALARALGIPSRLGFADIQNHQVRGPLAEVVPAGIIYHHCFLEWHVGGRWLKATPSFDRPLCQQLGWPLVEFDPKADAVFPAQDLKGQPFITYLRYHGWQLGVPLEEFLSISLKAYGPEGLERWKDLGRQTEPGDEA